MAALGDVKDPGSHLGQHWSVKPPTNTQGGCADSTKYRSNIQPWAQKWCLGLGTEIFLCRYFKACKSEQ